MNTRSLLSACFSWMLLGAHMAVAGPDRIGNGGDLTSRHFRETARSLVDKLSLSPELLPHGVDLRKLEQSVRRAHVTSTLKELCIDDPVTGRCEHVDAKNYPDASWIEVNKPSWDGLDARSQQELALHEHLALIGAEGSNDFSVSSPLVATLETGLCRSPRAVVTLRAVIDFTPKRSVSMPGSGLDPENPIMLSKEVPTDSLRWETRYFRVERAAPVAGFESRYIATLQLTIEQLASGGEMRLGYIPREGTPMRVTAGAVGEVLFQGGPPRKDEPFDPERHIAPIRFCDYSRNGKDCLHSDLFVLRMPRCPRPDQSRK